MKRYLITNPRYNGEAMLLYNPDGLLQKIDLSQTDMNAITITAFKKSVPAASTELQTAFSAETIIVESEVGILLEQFWVKYDHKFNKPRFTQLWERLSKTDKILAFFAIDKYNKYLRKHPTQAKLHPDTYIRNKAWLNDYK